MPPRREPLEPTPFEPAPPSAPTAGQGSGAPRWVLPALVVLVALALLVIFWKPQAPQPIAGTGNDTGAAAQTQARPPAAKPPGAVVPDAAPWSEAQAARLRKEAKDVLAQLLDVQFQLDERHAGKWAADDYAQAQATAKHGDDQYREQAYVEARQTYAQALQQMQAILERAPQAVDAGLREARQAIEDGDTDGAQAALDLVAGIEPENAGLAGLHARVENLPDVNALLEQAAGKEAAGDLAAAETALASAAALDPDHRRVAAELERVRTAHREQQFSDAMSAGYRALDGGEYAAAREQFGQAAALRPDSGEASSALQELAVAEQSARLAALKRQGAAQEAAENWQAAVQTYRQALEIDSSVVFAMEGSQRAKQRAELDRSLRAVIAEPARLAEVAVAEDTADLLQRASAITPAGTLLRQQVATVRELLDKANTPVPVILRSDGETEVLIYKVARLGRFTERSLELRPGVYRVRGSRTGYRDVLQTLEVTAGRPPPPLSVVCTESIL